MNKLKVNFRELATFATYAVAFFSLTYVGLNFNVILDDVSYRFSQNDEKNESSNPKEEEQASFVLFDGGSPERDYSSFPGMNQADSLVKILKAVSLDATDDAFVKIDETEVSKKESSDEKKVDIIDVSTEMSSEEWKKYGTGTYVVIPKIKVEAPISFPSVEEYDLEAVILKKLEEGVVHRPETQLPNQNGNFFLIGHSSNFPWIRSKFNNVFAKIPKLENGDEAFVFFQGRKFVYETYAKFVVPADALDVYGYIPGHNMSLMTCYPIGTDKNRMIVRLKLKKNN